MQPLKTDSLLSRLETLCKCLAFDGVEKLKAYSIFYDVCADILPLLQGQELQHKSFNQEKDAVEYLERNSEKDFSVAYLAQTCLLSESRFYTLFKDTMGCSPIVYRNSLKFDIDELF